MVNKDGTIQHTKVVKGQSYRVVATKRGAANGVWFARDTIVNDNTGSRKELTRKEWFKLFKNY